MQCGVRSVTLDVYSVGESGYNVSGYVRQSRRCVVLRLLLDWLLLLVTVAASVSHPRTFTMVAISLT